MYNLKLNSLEEFICIQRQIDFMTKGEYIIDFEANLSTRMFILGKKLVSPKIQGKYSLYINRKRNQIKYSLAEELLEHEEFIEFISNNAILEAPLAFIEEVDDIVIRDIKNLDESSLSIKGLDNTERINYIDFLNLVCSHRDCNYLDIKFRAKEKIVYAQYFNERFIRKSAFNGSNKKVSVYINTVDDLIQMFGELSLEHLNFGYNYLDLPELVQCYKDVARKRNYVFKYVIH